MRVRKIDPVNGRVFGGGQNAFWVNQPEGVAQCARTRLNLWQGQWFLNVPEGTPWATQVLGKYTETMRDAAVRQRVLGTPGATAITAYSVSFDRFSRKWTGQMTIETAFGPVTTPASSYTPPVPSYLVTEAGVDIVTEGGSPLMTL